MRKYTRGPLRAVSKMLKCYLYALLLGSSLLFNSCKGGSSLASKGTEPNDMELIVSENYSGYTAQHVEVIKDQKSLLSFYGTINRTRKPGLVPPNIDFSTTMLLVWCAGEQFSDAIELEISPKADTLFVKKIKQNTAKKKGRPVVSPFVIYKLPLNPNKIKFQ